MVGDVPKNSIAKIGLYESEPILSNGFTNFVASILVTV
jgi:hypothetical protein